MEYLIGMLVLTIFILSFKSLSWTSVGGTSLYSSDGNVSIKGKVLSVTKEEKVLMGDPFLPPKGANTIRQKADGCSVLVKGGHVVIEGVIKSLKVNGKKLI